MKSLEWSLLAVDIERYNRGASIGQWALTAVGVAVAGIGIYMLAEKAKASKDGRKTNLIAQRIAGVILCIGGAATIAYAWLSGTFATI